MPEHGHERSGRAYGRASLSRDYEHDGGASPFNGVSEYLAKYKPADGRKQREERDRDEHQRGRLIAIIIMSDRFHVIFLTVRNRHLKAQRRAAASEAAGPSYVGGRDSRGYLTQ